MFTFAHAARQAAIGDAVVRKKFFRILLNESVGRCTARIRGIGQVWRGIKISLGKLVCRARRVMIASIRAFHGQDGLQNGITQPFVCNGKAPGQTDVLAVGP